jgi:hypothetical protein
MRKAKRSAEVLSKRKRALREKASAEPVNVIPYSNNDARKVRPMHASRPTDASMMPRL